MTDLIQFRRGTSAEWATANPILAVAEPGLDTSTGTFKIGDGVSVWAVLPVIGGLAGLESSLDVRYVSGVSGAGGPGGTGVSGQWYWDTTNKRSFVSDGVGWIIMAEQTVTSYVPTVTSTGGTITTVGAVAFAYRRHDGWLDYHTEINITTNGTGSGAVRFTLPIATSAVTTIGNGREVNSNGHTLTVTASSVNNGDILKYDNSYPGGSGFLLQVTGRYQMTTRYS